MDRKPPDARPWRNRNPEILAEQLVVREWLATHDLPEAGSVTAASIALAVALIAEQGVNPIALAGPDDIVELIAAITATERLHVIAAIGGDVHRPGLTGLSRPVN